MAKFSDVELAIIAIILDEEERAKQRVKKRKWAHEAWRERESEKEFATLYKKLIDDGTKLSQHFKTEAHLKKRNIHLRKAITPREQLAVCMRTKKRKWVHEAWKKRESEGEFAALYKELIDDETKFFQYFRMSKNCFNMLLSKTEAHLKKKDTHLRKAITSRERLAVCLRYLATGDSLRTISFRYRLGHSTVYKIVTDTCQIITENLMSEMLPNPSTEMWKSVANDFFTLWNYPNCLGALGGKHFTTQASKKRLSVALLALVDAHYNFIVVDIGAYGKNSEGGIFANSSLGKTLQRGTLSVPENAILPGTPIEAPYVLLGDEAFPLKTYLMRPYPGQDLDTSRYVFNYRLCHARRVVENTFDIVAQKFRICNRRIQAKPENVDHIIHAICILHNFIRKYDVDTYPYATANESSEARLENLPIQGGNATREALAVRDLYKDYFNSEAISVPWQF